MILLGFNLIVNAEIIGKKNLKVCIASKLTTCIIHSSVHDMSVYDKFNNKIQHNNKCLKIYYVDKNNISIDGCVVSLPVVIQPSIDGDISVCNKQYRGNLLLQQSYVDYNSFDIINIICVEDYLKGVLPKEIYPNWGFEALKVQAIISRTYALNNCNKHVGQGFNICSSTHCQVYEGVSAEVEVCNKAILETERQVVTYKGLLAQTVFHSICGGHTEDPKHIWDWQKTPKYLRGVKCSYCSQAPYFHWIGILDEKFIRDQLLLYTNISEIQKINIKERTTHGTVKQLEIIHSRGKFNLNAYKFRLAISAWVIKSNAFSNIKKDGDKFYFKGKGWGHRVGLCQWGTKKMAEKGKTYKYILSHFYPKTIIDKIKYQD
jgi:stage II sporulation protein D